MPTPYEIRGEGRELALGIMSGTSLDGIDVFIGEIAWQPESTGEAKTAAKFFDFQLTLDKIYSASYPYGDAIRQSLEKLTASSEVSLAELVTLDKRLGEAYAAAVNKTLAAANIASSEIAFLGCHGQTVFHRAGAGLKKRLQENEKGTAHKNNLDKSKGETLSLQLGSAALLAEKTNIISVTNFRQRDIAAGGEGAPLVPIFDYLFYSSPAQHRILINIGGIANYTILPARGSYQEIRGSDTGPGNMMLDAAVKIITDGEKSYDIDGKMAAQGRAKEAGLDFLWQNSFFNRDLPRSTGRDDFGLSFVRSYLEFCQKNNFAARDIIATLTEFTVQAIARTLLLDIENLKATTGYFDDSKEVEILVSGGGSLNQEMMTRLSRTLKKKLNTREEFEEVKTRPLNSKTTLDLKLPKISAQEKEAAAFALLAWLTLNNKPGNIPQITGASRPVVLGEITY